MGPPRPLLPIVSVDQELKTESSLGFSSSPASSPTRLMASPAAAPASEFTAVEAARRSLIAISQSVPEMEAAVVPRPPSGGGMERGHDDGAEQRYRAKLISISNQSPDARPSPCPPRNAAA